MAIEVYRVGLADTLGLCEGCGSPGVDVDGNYIDGKCPVAELEIGGTHVRLCYRCLRRLEIVARYALLRVLEKENKS